MAMILADEYDMRPYSTSMRPNLFDFATSELSQDAFICWFLSWADEQYAKSHQCLHSGATGLLKLMLSAHNLGNLAQGKHSIHVNRQRHKIDILVEVGEVVVLLIEDKIDTSEHGGQLDRYLAAARAEFPNRHLAPIFLKTGEQSSYQAVIKAGFKLVSRSDLLKVLQLVANCNSEIVTDFRESLLMREKAHKAFEQKRPSIWDSAAWTGFYVTLQEVFPDLGWGYVPNASGGFMGAWWSWATWNSCEVYLQIEQQKLCFKMTTVDTVDSSSKRAQLRNSFFELLSSAMEAEIMGVERPTRFGNGKQMTAAIVPPQSWLMTDRSGNLNLKMTIKKLQELTKFFSSLIVMASEA